MPYCLSCGRNVKETECGLCSICHEDFKVACKHNGGAVPKDATVDLAFLEARARKHLPNGIAAATLIAISDAYANGSEYGW